MGKTKITQQDKYNAFITFLSVFILLGTIYTLDYVNTIKAEGHSVGMIWPERVMATAQTDNQGYTTTFCSFDREDNYTPSTIFWYSVVDYENETLILTNAQQDTDKAELRIYQFLEYKEIENLTQIKISIGYYSEQPYDYVHLWLSSVPALTSSVDTTIQTYHHYFIKDIYDKYYYHDENNTFFNYTIRFDNYIKTKVKEFGYLRIDFVTILGNDVRNIEWRNHDVIIHNEAYSGEKMGLLPQYIDVAVSSVFIIMAILLTPYVGYNTFEDLKKRLIKTIK